MASQPGPSDVDDVSAPAQEGAGPGPVPTRAKRAQIMVACEACRKGKAKCTGDRPVCRRCKARSLQCDYSADADESSLAALRRRHLALRKSHAEQEEEIARLRLLVAPTFAASSPGAGSSATTSSPASTMLLASPEHQSFSPMDQTPSTEIVSFISPQPQRHSEEAGDHVMSLLHALASGTDIESTRLLARLRMGEDWSKIARDLPFEPYTSDAMIQQTDQSAPQQAHVVLKRWLPAVFDRQYFMQVCFIPCAPGPPSLPFAEDLTNGFGNLPFSSAISANYHPEHVQEAQQRNLVAPEWARLVLNGTTGNVDPFEAMFAEMMGDISNGAPVDDVCGLHPYIGALDDEDTFYRAPKLSQMVARTVRSIKATESKTTFTQYAMMFWFWALWRWMLNPTKETYRDIPAFAKPTSSQLFISHPFVFDFVLLPKLRDLVCQVDTPDIRWFTEAAATIHCNWDRDTLAALCRDGVTNELDFNPICRAYIASEQNWALGPSVRPFLANVDSFIEIR